MKTCKCINNILKELKEKFGNEVELTNEIISLNGHHFPHLRFRFHPKKADGNKSKKWKSSFVHNNFCPICGKKI